MRSASLILLLTGLAIVVAAALADDGLALFTSQPNIAGNAFDTDDCFPNNNTGFRDPSAEAAIGGDGFEVNPTNAFADGGTDPNYKAENIDGADEKHFYYDYGISIDSSCVIAGIELRLDWWLNDLGGTSEINVRLSWDAGTSFTTSRIDNVETTSEHTAVLGSPTDTWDRTWSPTELTNANFRVRLSTECVGSCNGRNFFLDWVPVKVYYGP